MNIVANPTFQFNLIAPSKIYTKAKYMYLYIGGVVGEHQIIDLTIDLEKEKRVFCVLILIAILHTMHNVHTSLYSHKAGVSLQQCL